jgi:DNA helicase HerA-like ATPase
MSRLPLFLITAFLACVAMIGFSLRSLLPSKPQSVEARQNVGAMVFDIKSLNQFAAATGFPVTAAPGPRGDQIGPRLATTSVLAPGATNSKGARLLLGPATAAAIGDRPISVIVTMRGIPKSAASGIAIGLVGSGPVTWVRATVPADFAPVRIDLPATQQPIKALAIWPSLDGGGKGVEVRAISIQTASP